MKGSLTKRGWRWYATVELDRVNGKRQQKRIALDPSIKTKKAAEAELARITTEMHSGRYVMPSNVTMTDLFREHWLPHKTLTASAKTIERYGEIVERRLIPAFGSVLVSKLHRLESSRLMTNGSGRPFRPDREASSFRSEERDALCGADGPLRKRCDRSGSASKGQTRRDGRSQRAAVSSTLGIGASNMVRNAGRP